MASTRDIKRRIKSISNTKKVTGAMQMVSAAKMRKAVEATLKTRFYANLSWATVLNLSRATGQGQDGRALNRFFESRKDIKKVGIILVSSNRGLCGGFNASLMKKVHESITKYTGKNGAPYDTEFILLGKKGSAIYKQFGYNIAADFPKDDLAGSIKDILPLAKMAREDFLAGKYDKIFVAYADYISAIKQEPRVRQILPIDERAHKDFVSVAGNGHNGNGNGKTEYLFEPTPEDVLDEMVPRLIEVQIYQAMLESAASEHSARMAAMRQATDAAGELVDELTLFYNKARQAGITAEIAEISAGANALKK